MHEILELVFTRLVTSHVAILKRLGFVIERVLNLHVGSERMSKAAPDKSKDCNVWTRVVCELTHCECGLIVCVVVEDVARQSQERVIRRAFSLQNTTKTITYNGGVMHDVSSSLFGDNGAETRRDCRHTFCIGVVQS